MPRGRAWIALGFAGLILASFVVPYAAMREGPPFALMIFWSAASIASILLAYIALRG